MVHHRCRYLRELIAIIVLVLLIAGLLIRDFISQNEKIIGVYFYPWYSPDGRHWDPSVDPSWAVVEQPLIGFYDSRDEQVIRWQLKLIRDAGIDFIAISWWGPGSFEDEAAKIIVRYLREYNLKFAVLIEPYLGSNNSSLYDKGFWESSLRYIMENFIEPYGNAYMYLHGKPLVLAFNPLGLMYRPREDFPEFTIRIVGNDIDNAGYQDWDYWPDYLYRSERVELRIRRDSVVSVVPRFCDTHFRAQGMCIDPDLTHGFYRKQWDWVLRNADKVSIVMITSWNEYHERTQIEPSFSNQTADPWFLYNTTKEYIALLKKRSMSNVALSIVASVIVVLISVMVIKLKLNRNE
ncbi:MAG: hypothetical protein QW211_00580 [Desulfurococcaceae archaeon]